MTFHDVNQGRNFFTGLIASTNSHCTKANGVEVSQAVRARFLCKVEELWPQTPLSTCRGEIHLPPTSQVRAGA